ncbi:amidohydrolase family protein [Ramlibacter tataouinensis]|uniref:amidohydrolase family protein n=1 Tax=Ramlibacter tataouinensis TaxID=94132 RepID=UPI0006768B8C|nr:amidohydrolase family protein [Ramlibacter tataouinensis]
MSTPPPPQRVAATGWDCHVHVFDDAPAAPGAHYAPVRRPLADIEALAAAHGFGHLVLVQPSVYGTDNSVLLRALRAGAGRHRGVAVLDALALPSLLDEMHEAGVRGVRFNLVSPVGSQRQAALAQLRSLAPRLRARGWHVQWYARAEDLPVIQRCQDETGLCFVLDHLAGMTPAAPAHDPAWEALSRLAAAGCWVKLSGWYRLHAAPPYDALAPTLCHVAALFDDRLVWGSDWPHTSFEPQALPVYESLWTPVVRVLGEARAAALRVAGQRLYA